MAISAFTMDLVVALSKYAGCYEELRVEQNRADPNSNRPIEVCPRNHNCNHKRYYSYEKLADLLYGGWIKLFVNVIILFYLCIAITTYFIIIKVCFGDHPIYFQLEKIKIVKTKENVHDNTHKII